MHSTGLRGAHLIGSPELWEPGFAKRIDALISHATDGFLSRPRKNAGTVRQHRPERRRSSPRRAGHGSTRGSPHLIRLPRDQKQNTGNMITVRRQGSGGIGLPLEKDKRPDRQRATGPFEPWDTCRRYRRRPRAANPIRPRPSSSAVPGSGTGLCVAVPSGSIQNQPPKLPLAAIALVSLMN